MMIESKKHISWFDGNTRPYFFGLFAYDVSYFGFESHNLSQKKAFFFYLPCSRMRFSQRLTNDKSLNYRFDSRRTWLCTQTN